MMRDGRGLLYSFFVSHDSIDLPSSWHRREREERLFGKGLSGPNHINWGVSMVTPVCSHRGQSWFGPVRGIHCCLSPKKNKTIHFCLPSCSVVFLCCSSSSIQPSFTQAACRRISDKNFFKNNFFIPV